MRFLLLSPLLIPVAQYVVRRRRASQFFEVIYETRPDLRPPAGVEKTLPRRIRRRLR